MAFETFLSGLTERLSEPTQDYPTTRCWKRSVLEQLAGSVCTTLVQEGRLQATQAKPKTFVQLLIDSGLAHPVEGVRVHVAEKVQFLTVDIGASVPQTVDAYELLQAFKPMGVICYFSALSFHSLTTQPVTHHHVAELTAPSPVRQYSEATSVSSPSPNRTPPNPLGTISFTYQGADFFMNRREARLVPGVQSRWAGPRTKLRMTTLEQTLLDTLHRPRLCGGDTIVFEAWEEAGPRFDQERMALHLADMGSPDLTRRVGAMLDYFSLRAEEPLFRVLATSRQDPGAGEPITLLPGAAYRNLNSEWAVHMP